MDFNLERIVKLVVDNDLGGITISDGDKKIEVKGKVAVAAPAAPVAAAVSVSAPAPVESAITGNVVKSPIVGTFYSSPSPEKPAFVSVGSVVKKGDVLMIIESMKVMNEVLSEFDGTVTKILVNNGDIVEFDQNLMIIE